MVCGKCRIIFARDGNWRRLPAETRRSKAHIFWTPRPCVGLGSAGLAHELAERSSPQKREIIRDCIRCGLFYRTEIVKFNASALHESESAVSTCAKCKFRALNPTQRREPPHLRKSSALNPARAYLILIDQI